MCLISNLLTWPKKRAGPQSEKADASRPLRFVDRLHHITTTGCPRYAPDERNRVTTIHFSSAALPCPFVKTECYTPSITTVFKRPFSTLFGFRQPFSRRCLLCKPCISLCLHRVKNIFHFAKIFSAPPAKSHRLSRSNIIHPPYNDPPLLRDRSISNTFFRTQRRFPPPARIRILPSTILYVAVLGHLDGFCPIPPLSDP